ncbi:MAG: hypothetical protein ACUVXF_01955 [Desulfobaccales bacterium]
MSKRKISLILLASVIALMAAANVEAAAPGPEPLPPYLGVIRNNSSHEISIPSANSLGTLIIPPRSWIEFVAWNPNFDLISYWQGKPYGCHKVAVTPKAFPYMCKNYDFLVEINPSAGELGKQRYEKKYKPRVRKKRRA